MNVQVDNKILVDLFEKKANEFWGKDTREIVNESKWHWDEMGKFVKSGNLRLGRQFAQLV